MLTKFNTKLVGNSPLKRNYYMLTTASIGKPLVTESSE